MIATDTVFKIRPKVRFLLGLMVLLLFVSTVFIPYMIVTNGQTYPDLDTAVFFASIPFILLIAALVDVGPRAKIITLQDGQFSVRTVGQKTKTYSYDTIRGYNERPWGEHSFLSVYLKNSYFTIWSNEFTDYVALKNHFQQYGRSLPRQRVLMAYERNAFRWLLVGLALTLIASIGFGYLAHNDDGGKPATLIKVTGMVRYASVDRSRYGIKGLSVQLWNYPNFSFYLSRHKYDDPVRILQSKFFPGVPVTVQIRESDYRKKITRTDSTTFGDKYSGYGHIPVFGIGQGHWIDFQANAPARESGHTRPDARTFFSGFFLLCCWAGWVGLNRFTILRGQDSQSR